MIGGRLVQVSPQRQTLLLELGFVPVRVGDDELTGSTLRSTFPDRVEELGERPGFRQIHTRPAAHRMEVIARQSRDDRLALEVDDLRCGSRKRSDGRVISHRRDTIVCDSHRLGDGEGVVHRDDLSAVEHEVW